MRLLLFLVWNAIPRGNAFRVYSVHPKGVSARILSQDAQPSPCINLSLSLTLLFSNVTLTSTYSHVGEVRLLSMDQLLWDSLRRTCSSKYSVSEVISHVHSFSLVSFFGFDVHVEQLTAINVQQCAIRAFCLTV